MTLSAGTRIDQYRIVRRLGSGGMADVYEADEADPPRRVALKVLPERHGSNPDTVNRFRREARAAASLNHRGIVQIFSVGHDTDSGLHYYSMRLLGGGDLVSRIEQGMTVGTSLRILRELAAAFGHAHERGLIHRDVKPANVLFDEQDHPVLTDFGIAKALHGSHLTVPGTAVGTPAYMSPEQATSKLLDGRSDLYGLGVILFEMLTGHLPFEADNQAAMIFKHLMEPVPRLPPEFAPLQGLVDTLMNKDPSSRPKDAGALIRLIDDWVEAHGSGRREDLGAGDAEHPLLLRTHGKHEQARQIVEPPPTLLKATPPPLRKSRRRLPWLAAGVSTCGLMGFAVISTRSPTPIVPPEIDVPVSITVDASTQAVPVAERENPEEVGPTPPFPHDASKLEPTAEPPSLPRPASGLPSLAGSDAPPATVPRLARPIAKASPSAAGVAALEDAPETVLPPASGLPERAATGASQVLDDVEGRPSPRDSTIDIPESAGLPPIPVAAESKDPTPSPDAVPDDDRPPPLAEDPASRPDRPDRNDRKETAIRRARDMGTY